MAIAIAFVAGLYWAAVFGPKHLDNLDVREAVAAIFNDSGRASPETLTTRFLGVVNSAKFASHYELDDNGERVSVGGLGLTEDNISIEVDTEAGTSTIRVEYDREVKLFPLDKYRKVHFVVQQSGAYPQ